MSDPTRDLKRVLVADTVVPREIEPPIPLTAPDIELVELTDVEIGDEYPDLRLILNDLSFVVRTMARVIPLMPERAEEKPLPADRLHELRAAWNAAVVAYGRCFTTGVRERLVPESIFGSEDELHWHRHFRDLRDKYIAHSVTDAERVRVLVGLRPLGASPRVVGLHDVLLYRAMEWRGHGVILHGLAQLAYEYVERRASVLRRTMLDAARALPIEQLEARPRVTSSGRLPDRPGVRKRGRR